MIASVLGSIAAAAPILTRIAEHASPPWMLDHGAGTPNPVVMTGIIIAVLTTVGCVLLVVSAME